MKKAVLLTIALTLAVFVPVAAASSVVDAYGNEGSRVVEEVVTTASSTDNSPSVQVKGSTASGQPVAASGALPFTGKDLGVIAAAGVVLLGVGVGVRRLGGDRK